MKNKETNTEETTAPNEVKEEENSELPIGESVTFDDIINHPDYQKE